MCLKLEIWRQRNLSRAGAKIDSKWRDYLSEDDEEPRTSQPTMNNALLLNGEITNKTQDDMKNPRNCQATMGKAASKWSEILDRR